MRRVFLTNIFVPPALIYRPSEFDDNIAELITSLGILTGYGLRIDLPNCGTTYKQQIMIIVDVGTCLSTFACSR